MGWDKLINGSRSPAKAKKPSLREVVETREVIIDGEPHKVEVYRAQPSPPKFVNCKSGRKRRTMHDVKHPEVSEASIHDAKVDEAV